MVRGMRRRLFAPPSHGAIDIFELTRPLASFIPKIFPPFAWPKNVDTANFNALLTKDSPPSSLFARVRTRQLPEWIFIRAGAVDRRNGNFQQSLVHGQLAAMMIPVVQH